MNIIEKVFNDDTIKFLQKTDDGLILETAFIEEKDRNIICFASQLGCTIGCKICYNGVFPNYFRSLNKNEIVEQCVNVINELDLLSKNKYTYVVFITLIQYRALNELALDYRINI